MSRIPKTRPCSRHVVFDLTDRLSANAGVRVSNDTKDVDFDNSLVAAPINIDDDHTDYRVGLDFKATDDLLVYGSVATGYRPPAYNPRPFTPAQAVAVGGEEAIAYELGLKSELFDRRLRAEPCRVLHRLQRAHRADRRNRVPGRRRLYPRIPGAIQDSNGNYCFAVTSLTNYEQLRPARSRARKWSSCGGPPMPWHQRRRRLHEMESPRGRQLRPQSRRSAGPGLCLQ